MRRAHTPDDFWDRVAVGPDDACWPWLGTHHRQGYGMMGFQGKHWLAHRLMVRLIGRPFRDSQHVIHVCDNPDCVNPKHLVIGDHAANMADMKHKGRQRSGGAKFSEEDVRFIRLLVRAGIYTRLIGRIVGTDGSHVSKIARRVVWSGV